MPRSDADPARITSTARKFAAPLIMSRIFLKIAPSLSTKQHRLSIIKHRTMKGVELMHVALSDLKVNVGKYVDLADTEDVIITKYGKPAAKIIRYDKEPWYMKKLPEKIASVENLFGTLPNDIDLDDVRTERLAK